jgi:F-type H+-transporting ATPase subunit delta
MASSQEKVAPVAQVYARSLHDLATASQQADELQAELESVVAMLDADPRLEVFLASPLVDLGAKRAALERALRGRASDLLVDALQVMRRKGRLGLVRAVALAYRRVWMDRKNRIEARVVSAVPLADEQRAELVRAVAGRTGREPVLVERVDPTLLGGLVVSIGDDRIDSTVASSLSRLGARLMARAADELVSDKSYVTTSE